MSFLHPSPDAAHPLRGSHAPGAWWVTLLVSLAMLFLGAWVLRYIRRSIQRGWLMQRYGVSTRRVERASQPFEFWGRVVMAVVTGVLAIVGSSLLLIQLAGRWLEARGLR